MKRRANATIPMMLEPISPTNYILTQIEFWETYHHHKEQMGFAATGLFLTGAAALTFLQPPALGDSPFATWLIFLGLVVITGLMGVFFVNWELKLREIAASMLRACGVLVVEWLTKPPTSEDLRLVMNPDGRPMTTALSTTYDQVKSTYKWHQDPRTIRQLTVALIVIWGLVALTHGLYVAFSTGAFPAL